MRKTIAITGVTMCVLAAPAFSQSTTVEGFDGGSDGGFTGNAFFEAAGGNPGGNAHHFATLFFQVIRTGGIGEPVNPNFLGDYSSFDQVTFGFDVKVDQLTNFFGQPIAREVGIALVDRDIMGPSGPSGVFFTLGALSSAGQPDWTNFSVTIDDPTSPTLPPGWIGFGDEDPMTFEPILPPGATFATVLASVDEFRITGAIPGFFFTNANFDMRVDNVSVEVTGAPMAEAYVDIKPGSCPNAFNRGSNGVLPVGLLGTDMFDVGMVDIDSLRLSRADGMGGMVAPNEGPPGPHTVMDDVGAPFDGMACECDELEPDGFTDLSIKFRTQEVVDALMLDYLPAGATVELVLSGVLMDGTAFAGSDCVQLVPPGTAPGMMSMTVGLPEVWTDAFPLDSQLDGGGFGTFQRTYPLDTVVTLTAQPDANGRAFLGWRINGNLRLRTQLTIPLRITGDLVRVEAVYETLQIDTQPIRPDGSVDGRPLRR